jgi:predicted GTPase
MRAKEALMASEQDLNGEECLGRAAAQAVAASRPVMDRVSGDVATVVWNLREGARQVASRARYVEETDESAGDRPLSLLAAQRKLFESVEGELLGLVQRQKAAIGTFNIVLFGRTGTGKSSLIEALTSGNGRTISVGDSDWTTEVTAVEWETCRLYDTPGIAGWGRTEHHSALERRAHDAIACADIVLLCFDSQSQQADEFAKAAAWISAYGKPVIAVLNNRNGRWRFPTRLHKREQRVQLSTAVAEHAGNIRDELARIGLADVPVVALNTMRAVYARASEPYSRQDQAVMRRQRSEVGQDRLLQWSNLPVLEELISVAIRTDAVHLRLGTMLRQVRAALSRASDQLQDELEEPVLRTAAEVERGIERVLRLIGLPAGTELAADGSATGQDAFTALCAAVAELQVARGSLLEVPASGEAIRHADHLIGAKLGPLRAAAQGRADQIIAQAMAERRDADSGEFSAFVYDELKISTAAEEVTGEITRYLNSQTALAVEDVRADISWIARESAVISGSAGARLGQVGKWVGIATRPASWAVGAMLTAAALNAWNPAGWMLGAASATAFAVGVIGRWLSRRVRREAARQRGEGLARSRANARRAVNETFDGLHEAISGQVASLLREELAEHALPAVYQALTLRTVAAVARQCRLSTEEARRAIDQPTDPAQVIRAAAVTCERAAGLAGPDAAAALWLGAAWCDDPAGLTDLAGAPGLSRIPRAAPRYVRRLSASLRGVLRAAAATPARGAGRAWLARAEARLADDPQADALLGELRILASDPRPHIVICGGYDTGKSSFIRRLLVDGSQQVPGRLRIAAAPTTGAAGQYEWQGMVLVDTPGFQSGQDSHAAAAHASAQDAALVIYLFNPSLDGGEQADLGLVLGGDPKRGIVAKLSRSLLIINRSDLLGVDPAYAPEQFTRLAERKVTELAQMLTAHPGLRGASVDQARIICMASAPHELRIESRRDADDYRSWDGFEEFQRAFALLRPTLALNGTDVTLLHGGIARLGGRAAAALDEAATLDRESEQLGRLIQDLRNQARAGQAMAGERQAVLQRRTEDFLSGLLSAGLESRDQQAREAIGQRLNEWHTDEEFTHEVADWLQATRKQVHAWQQSTRATLNQRVGSQSFADAFPNAKSEFPDVAAALGQARDGSSLVLPGGSAGTAWEETAATAQAAGEAISSIDIQSVIDLGEYFGHAFELATAAQIASEIADFGADLMMFGIVLDGAKLVWQAWRDKRQAAQQTRVITQLASTAHAAAEAIASGKHGKPGVLTGPKDACQALSAAADGLDRQRSARASRLNSTSEQLEVYEELMGNARALLGMNPEGGAR